MVAEAQAAADAQAGANGDAEGTTVHGERAAPSWVQAPNVGEGRCLQPRGFGSGESASESEPAAKRKQRVAEPP